MTEEPPDIAEFARRYARTANEGFAASAQLFRDLPEEAWSEPTGDTEWDMRTLAGHIVGEAVWFPNLIRSATRGEEPYPAQLYDDLKRLPPAELARRTQEAGTAIQETIEDSSEKDLQTVVDLGWIRMPVWQATAVSAQEAVLHNWDARIGRVEGATIPTEWAQALADVMPQFAPYYAREAAARAAPGRYLLHVGNGVGPVTIEARDGRITIEMGRHGDSDVTLDLTVDQYVRLLTGRFDLGSAEGHRLPIEGDHDRAQALNRIFAGIANG